MRLPEGDVPAPTGAGVSKSAASRHFVALSAARMKEWMGADLPIQFTTFDHRARSMVTPIFAATQLMMPSSVPNLNLVGFTSTTRVSRFGFRKSVVGPLPLASPARFSRSVQEPD
jgi:hypothetical protein